MSKTSQLQIRVTPEQKATLKRLAGAAGLSVSSYVLAQVIPSAQLEMRRIAGELAARDRDHREALRDLAQLLEMIPADDFTHGLSEEDLAKLSPTLRNYVAAMMEQAAHDRQMELPPWVLAIGPLGRPFFLWGLQSLRPHQIRVTPVPFKRRNVFFDPSGGPRV